MSFEEARSLARKILRDVTKRRGEDSILEYAGGHITLESPSFDLERSDWAVRVELHWTDEPVTSWNAWVQLRKPFLEQMRRYA